MYSDLNNNHFSLQITFTNLYFIVYFVNYYFKGILYSFQFSVFLNIQTIRYLWGITYF